MKNVILFVLIVLFASCGNKSNDSTETKTETDVNMVYVTPYGKRYHRENCPTIQYSNITAMTVDEATSYGKTRCKRCRPL